MKLVERIAHQIACDLRGTCNGYPDGESLLDALYNMNKVKDETYSTPDYTKLAKIFRQRENSLLKCVYEDLFVCDCCGWWYETYEQDENIINANICNGCGGEYEE